ncbi:MAG: hypothetical protein PVS2B2_26740 [Candidatus Acidiferrum sp.]
MAGSEPKEAATKLSQIHCEVACEVPQQFPVGGDTGSEAQRAGQVRFSRRELLPIPMSKQWRGLTKEYRDAWRKAHPGYRQREYEKQKARNVALGAEWQRIWAKYKPAAEGKG